MTVATKWENRWADQLSYSPGPDQNFELAYPNIYPVYELLNHMKGPVLKNQR